ERKSCVSWPNLRMTGRPLAWPWSCTPPYGFISVDGDGQRFELRLMADTIGNRLYAPNHHGVNGIALQGGLGVPDSWLPTALVECVSLRLQQAHRFDTLAIDEAHLLPFT